MLPDLLKIATGPNQVETKGVDRIRGLRLGLAGKKYCIVDIVGRKKLLGMRAAIFICLHKNYLRWERPFGEINSQPRSIENCTVESNLDMNGMRLAALIADDIYIVNGHGLSLRSQPAYVSRPIQYLPMLLYRPKTKPWRLFAKTLFSSSPTRLLSHLPKRLRAPSIPKRRQRAVYNFSRYS